MHQDEAEVVRSRRWSESAKFGLGKHESSFLSKPASHASVDKRKYKQYAYSDENYDMPT